MLFGPWAGGVGAALGTLIADSVKHGGLYPGSLLASVPGNFVGFFIMGYFLRKKFNWARFITATNVSLIVSNLMVAFLYVFLYKTLYAQTIAFTESTTGTLTVLSLGLTIFWFVTMLPFVLLIVPPLIAVASHAFPSIISPELRDNGAKVPRRLLGASMLLPGIVMVVLGLVLVYMPLEGILSSNFVVSYFPVTSVQLIQLLLFAGGIVLSVLGGTALLKEKRKKENVVTG